MLEITEEAMKFFPDLRQEGDHRPAIRIAVMGTGGTDTGLGLVPDEILENDLATQHGEFTVVIDKKLMEYCQSITIDFSHGEPNRCASLSKRGFAIKAKNPVKL
ncbi:hypothetical protein [Desulfosediminicola ganghwensis]|nr:hypothetical protein [Desulfosediminicola ganghwensis]